jgi:hypothetical protein
LNFATRRGKVNGEGRDPSMNSRIYVSAIGTAIWTLVSESTDGVAHIEQASQIYRDSQRTLSVRVDVNQFGTEWETVDLHTADDARKFA